MKDGLKSKSASEVENTISRSNQAKEIGRLSHNWVIGDPEFVKEVLQNANKKRLRIKEYTSVEACFETLAQKICAHYGISVETLKNRQRLGPGSDSRKLFSFVACKHYHLTTTQVAEYLNVGPAAVSFILKGEGRCLLICNCQYK